MKAAKKPKIAQIVRNSIKWPKCSKVLKTGLTQNTQSPQSYPVPKAQKFFKIPKFLKIPQNLQISKIQGSTGTKGLNDSLSAFPSASLAFEPS